ncbi:transcriptional regulator, partial [Salmonella enterica subsp. enterica serovar Kentucky]|nr:transcriptional regulator [Salmonella enterica subsp. enterica serovar Kentucky]
MVNSSVLVLCFITLPPKLTFSKYVQKGKYQ